MSTDEQWKVCRQKRTYRSKSKAKRWLRINHKFGMPYRCDTCGKWHVTTKAKWIEKAQATKETA